MGAPAPVPDAGDVQPVEQDLRDRIITGLVTGVPMLALGVAAWRPDRQQSRLLVSADGGGASRVLRDGSTPSAWAACGARVATLVYWRRSRGGERS